MLADKKSRGSPGSSVICGTDDSSARVQIRWFSNSFFCPPKHFAFSNHDRFDRSRTNRLEPKRVPRFSNHGRSGRSQTYTRSLDCLTSSVTVADQAGLKPVGADTPFEQGLSISKNCKICQVFLFLRPARSFSGSRISASVYSRPDGGMNPL